MFRSKEEIILTAIVGTFLIIVFSVIIILSVIKFKSRQREFIKEKALLNSQFEQELLQTQLEIQEQTFNYVSQEIHDNIGQVLSLVRLNIRTLEEYPAKEKFENLDELISKALNDLRGLTRKLNTNYIKKVGLVEAIRQLLLSVQQSGRFQTSFIVEENHFEIDENKSIILYRIIQEVVNNIIKHSGASKIDVCIKRVQFLELICIADDGKGFDINVIHGAGSGLGINNMIARSKIIGAQLDIDSSFNKGTTITIHNIG